MDGESPRQDVEEEDEQGSGEEDDGGEGDPHPLYNPVGREFGAERQRGSDLAVDDSAFENSAGFFTRGVGFLGIATRFAGAALLFASHRLGFRVRGAVLVVGNDVRVAALRASVDHFALKREEGDEVQREACVVFGDGMLGH